MSSAQARRPEAGHITVHIRYLSAVRDRTGRREDLLHLPVTGTLAEVSVWLRDSYGLEVPGPDLMSTLNGRGWSQSADGLATRLQEGDQIALFPLLSGG